MRNLVRSARQRVAVAVNSEAISLYWQVGCRIKKDILKGGRGAYGEETVKKCAAFLTGEFGSGWGFRTIQHCVRVAYTFTEAEIVYALRTQLSWTHVRALMGIDDELKRMFYLEMAAHEHWSTRRMEEKIDAMLFERTAISRKPEAVIRAELAKVGEESPIGLILCSEGNTEHIEYLMLDEENIRVAQYFTQLPSKELLRGKLQRAVAIAGETLAERRTNR